MVLFLILQSELNCGKQNQQINVINFCKELFGSKNLLSNTSPNYDSSSEKFSNVPIHYLKILPKISLLSKKSLNTYFFRIFLRIVILNDEFLVFRFELFSMFYFGGWKNQLSLELWTCLFHGQISIRAFFLISLNQEVRILHSHIDRSTWKILYFKVSEFFLSLNFALDSHGSLRWTRILNLCPSFNLTDFFIIWFSC